jgi:hypothetical protein
MATPAYLKAFRDFVDAQPDIQELPAMEKEFYLGTDRPAVILQASNVENLLQMLIEKAMRQPLANDLKARVFDGSGPLSTFSSKILVGFAFGLFGPVFRHDLELVKELRNGFAHARRPMELTNGAIAGVCANLQLPDHELRRLPFAYGDQYPDLEVVNDNNHPRTRFTVACHTISLQILLKIEHWELVLP